MSSGESIKGKDICKGVILKMQGLMVVENVLPIVLVGTEIILGMQ